MKVAVFGLGYVGLTAMCCIASSGHRTVGLDINAHKVLSINGGISPIVEPNLEKLLREALEHDLITADTEIGSNLDSCDLALVCVGTPPAADGSHDMRYIAEVTRQIAEAIRPDRKTPLTVAYRSTMRPGTTEELIVPMMRSILGERFEELVELVYHPEFLREGTAVGDYFDPPKIVMGTRDGEPSARVVELNRGIVAPAFTVRYKEAEITKFVDNSWHAAKVVFANEIGRLCLALNISAEKVHEIFISDTKLNISPCYLRPGGAFGGSCLVKDVRALQHAASKAGEDLPMIGSLLPSNAAHGDRLFAHAIAGLPAGSRVLLAGLAFKAGTDDLRESPNVDLARKLLASGFVLEIFDPSIDAARLLGANLDYARSHMPSLERLLVSRDHAQSAHYDRIIAANSTISELTLASTADVIDISALP